VEEGEEVAVAEEGMEVEEPRLVILAGAKGTCPVTALKVPSAIIVMV